MLFVTGLVSRVPAHLRCVYTGEVFVFAVTAYATFADSVVQFAAFIFKLVDGKTLTDVSAVDDEAFGHV
jgi:hypothetical protein